MIDFMIGLSIGMNAVLLFTVTYQAIIRKRIDRLQLKTYQLLSDRVDIISREQDRLRSRVRGVEAHNGL